MPEYLFNRNPIKLGKTIDRPDTELIRNTPCLFRASLKDAMLYGGDLTREALSAMDIKGDRKYVIVDTKVHMLMPGMWPAIPGWHTDAAPRPLGKPDLDLQTSLDQLDGSVHFHLLVTGEGCLTDFMEKPTEFAFEDGMNDSDLYKKMTNLVNGWASDDEIIEAPSCTVVEWDWWNIHRAKAATKREWRFLIRVTETDHQPPLDDLRDILRSQQQVYVPSEAFGW